MDLMRDERQKQPRRWRVYGAWWLWRGIVWSGLAFVWVMLAACPGEDPLRSCDAGCLLPEDCSSCGDRIYCLRGACNKVQCEFGSDCLGGQICEQGKCVPKLVGCKSDSECQSGQRCDTSNGLCFPITSDCLSDNDCKEGEVCITGDCKIKEGGACSSTSGCGVLLKCIANKCQPSTTVDCRADGDCAQGQTCEDQRCRGGEGIPCKSNAECRSQFVCSKGSCSQPCQFNENCVKDKEACRMRTCITTCQADGDCGDGEVCVSGFCGPKAGSTCKGDRECWVGYVCVSGKCATANDDKGTCSTGSDCHGFGASQTCNEGKCEGVCTEDAECRPGFGCAQNRCYPDSALCTSDGDCSSGEKCIARLCAGADGIKCKTTADCPNSSFKCVGEICRGAPGAGCLVNSDCQGSMRCVKQRCTNICYDAKSCNDATLSCISGACLKQCKSQADCASGETCRWNHCLPAASGRCRVNHDCSPLYTCVNGTCTAPSRRGEGGKCFVNEDCDFYPTEGIWLCIKGECKPPRACQTADDCGVFQECKGGWCRAELKQSCQRSSDCAATLTCVERECQKACTPDIKCGTGLTCKNGRCLSACNDETPCTTAGEACVDSLCVQQAGILCRVDRDCAAGQVCADEICTATSQSTTGYCLIDEDCQITEGKHGTCKDNACQTSP